MDADKPTLIDAKAEVEGTLIGKDVQVLGRFKGEIEISGRLVVGEGGRVEARVTADAVEVAGDLKGDLKTRSLVLLEKARVDGNLDAQILAVREGAQLNGAVNTGAESRADRGARTAPPPAAEPVKPAEPAKSVEVEVAKPAEGAAAG
ncbi:MAG TPA: polymer-forming cytoskeletal protein [Vicinamibacteria bacterium]